MLQAPSSQSQFSLSVAVSSLDEAAGWDEEEERGGGGQPGGALVATLALVAVGALRLQRRSLRQMRRLDKHV